MNHIAFQTTARSNGYKRRRLDSPFSMTSFRLACKAARLASHDGFSSLQRCISMAKVILALARRMLSASNTPRKLKLLQTSTATLVLVLKLKTA